MERLIKAVEQIADALYRIACAMELTNFMRDPRNPAPLPRPPVRS